MARDTVVAKIMGHYHHHRDAKYPPPALVLAQDKEMAKLYTEHAQVSQLCANYVQYNAFADLEALSRDDIRAQRLQAVPSRKVNFLLAYLDRMDGMQQGLQGPDPRLFPEPASDDDFNGRPIKVVIYCYHHTVASYVCLDLQVAGSSFVNLADEKADDCHVRIKQWEECGRAHILVITKRNITGLNLQRAEVMFFIQINFLQLDNDQAAGRICRTGQQKECYILRKTLLSRTKRQREL